MIKQIKKTSLLTLPMIYKEYNTKLSYNRMQICAELVNYSGDSSEESVMMHPRTVKMGRLPDVTSLKEGGARLVLVIKAPQEKKKEFKKKMRASRTIAET